MKRIRILTAGESHGRALVALVEGFPAGLEIDPGAIDADLRRRQSGFGRGARMEIEQDRVVILSGVRCGRTIGSPIALYIENRDWRPDGSDGVSDPASAQPITIPRPGHADLAGAVKYALSDMRDVAERASARETASRCAAGSIARIFLSHFGMTVGSHVLRIGPVEANRDLLGAAETLLDERGWSEIFLRAERSPVRCADPETTGQMMREIARARERGDTLGGVFETVVVGVPIGLGSYIHWDRRLDGLLAWALMSVNGVKGVQIGAGFDSASRPGSAVHDAIYPAQADAGSEASGPLRNRVGPRGEPSTAGRPRLPWERKTNRAGGLEGGVTNGCPVVVRAAMKPIATLMEPLDTVDVVTGRPAKAPPVRSDVCAVPAAAVVGESMMALILADAFLEKFGADTMGEIRRNYGAYLACLANWKGGVRA